MAQPIYSTESVRRIDANAIQGGIPGYTLMSRAAEAAFAVLRRTWPDARTLTIVCGIGNNGGDGHLLARLAHSAGWQVQVITLSGESIRGSDAARARNESLDIGIDLIESNGTELPPCDVLVDALFGTGLSRPPQGQASTLIAAINRLGVPVLSLDVPSGVDADTGDVPGDAVHATVTLSFIAAKRGLFTGAALDHVGQLHLSDLSVPEAAFADVAPAAVVLRSEALNALPRRRANSHKGRHGHVLAVGGDLAYGGAIRLCAEAALRTGAGLVTALTRSLHVPALITARPECMALACDDGKPASNTQHASVIALGPGLGQGEWGHALFDAFIDDPRPQVLDADALNWLARAPRALPPQRVITPHPGEAARLLDTNVTAIQSDRFGSAARLAKRYRCVVVLKGAGSVIAAADEVPRVIAAGNPGMASGGMGDVLTGVIAALIVQGLPAFEAAWLGALLHADAGDRAASIGGQRGLLASDLLPFLRGDRPLADPHAA